tara:strand:+ start:796 stop:966 length:171 start_codon:yes stop_codon:yes gene_type:complete
MTTLLMSILRAEFQVPLLRWEPALTGRHLAALQLEKEPLMLLKNLLVEKNKLILNI